MTLGTGDILLFRVLFMPSGSCYLEPPGITTLMTFFTGLVLDYSVPFHSLIAPEGEINNQHGTGKQTLMVAAMAAYFSVLASGPTVPGLLHDMASSTEVRVILHIVIEMDKLVAAKGNGN